MTRRLEGFKKLAVVAVPLLALAVVGPAGAQDIPRTAMLDCTGLTGPTLTGQATLTWLDAVGMIQQTSSVDITCVPGGTTIVGASQPNGGGLEGRVATKWDLLLLILESFPTPTEIKSCHPGGRVTLDVPEEISKSCHAPMGNGFIKFTLMMP